jgi:hypothetical protein
MKFSTMPNYFRGTKIYIFKTTKRLLYPTRFFTIASFWFFTVASFFKEKIVLIFVELLPIGSAYNYVKTYCAIDYPLLDGDTYSG